MGIGYSSCYTVYSIIAVLVTIYPYAKQHIFMASVNWINIFGYFNILVTTVGLRFYVFVCVYYVLPDF